MSIKPLGNRAVIILEKTQTTKSGIIISTKQENEQNIGKVVAIGEGFDTEEGNISKTGLKVDDTVLIAKFGNEEVKDPSDPETVYKIVNMANIVAILEN